MERVIIEASQKLTAVTLQLNEVSTLLASVIQEKEVSEFRCVIINN